MVFWLISAVFEVFRVPLTPSFVGSNPGPATLESFELLRDQEDVRIIFIIE